MSGLNMDQLVEKLLTDSKARGEWLQVAKRLEDKYPNEKVAKDKPKTAFPSYKVQSRTTETDACRLNYEDGFSICFTPDGGMFLEHVEPGTDEAAPSAKSLKSISENTPAAFKSFVRDHLIDVEDLMFVVSSVGYMFSKEAVKAYERNKHVVATSEQKTRFISKDNKRAFVAGMVCGRITQ